MPNPVDNPGAYDVLMLGGRKVPGVVRMGEPTRDEGWDKQEPKGGDGGETVHNGAKLVEFDVDIYLWKDENVDHFAGWESFKSTLATTTKDNAQQALDIYHPVLDEIGVRSVVVKARTSPIPDGQGGATVKLKLLEYAPPKKKTTGKPAGSKGAGGQSDTTQSPEPIGGWWTRVGQGGGSAREPKPRPPTNVDKKARNKASTEELRSTGGDP